MTPEETNHCYDPLLVAGEPHKLAGLGADMGRSTTPCTAEDPICIVGIGKVHTKLHFYLLSTKLNVVQDVASLGESLRRPASGTF
jgi:hypothetical protein